MGSRNPIHLNPPQAGFCVFGIEDFFYSRLNRSLSLNNYPQRNSDMAKPHSSDELSKAIATLEEALVFAETVKHNPVQFKIARDACIQRFEYCIELPWKVAMKKLGSQTKFPKQAIREMARADLIVSAEAWLDFIEARNNSGHSYDEDVAQKVFSEILSFQKEVKLLHSNLDKLP